MQNIAQESGNKLVRIIGDLGTDKKSWYISAMRQLVGAIQELSQARDLATVIDITRRAARNITGADGATFVLRDGNQCHYADEDAISPLWKGSRFPMHTCISGWVMLNAQAAVIEDIYEDPRIPHDAYRPTFVKSLVMVPIRSSAPIGAIGNYWSKKRLPTHEEIEVLQALADTTSVAMENVALYSSLQEKIQALEDCNHELSRFAWVASHDLQEPLRTISTQIGLLSRKHNDKLDDDSKGYINLATAATRRLQSLIENLLVHSNVEAKLQFQPVNIEQIIQNAVIDDMRTLVTESGAEISYNNLPIVWGNPILLGRLFQNIISNAIKFTKKGEKPKIRVLATRENELWKFCVTDQGIGIDPEYHEKIFELFHRQHSQDIYSGSGIGLATCKKIIESHNGKIWVESSLGKGSSFYFTLTPTKSA